MKEQFDNACTPDAAGGAAAAQESGPRRVAEYALAIFARAVDPFEDDFINDNVNFINTFAAGFMKFCADALGLPEPQWTEACILFYTDSMNLDPREGAMHFNCAQGVRETPQGQMLFRQGQLAAWLCQEGRTEEAVAALGTALAELD